MDKNGIMKDEGEKEWVVEFFFIKLKLQNMKEVKRAERNER